MILKITHTKNPLLTGTTAREPVLLAAGANLAFMWHWLLLYSAAAQPGWFRQRPQQASLLSTGSFRKSLPTRPVSFWKLQSELGGIGGLGGLGVPQRDSFVR